jgi:hypothetical protein
MKTKFVILLILIVISTSWLAGCSRTTSTVTTSSGLSAATRLALGILKLEGSSQAVSTTQAGELLTLWQGYQSLSSSDTSSQVELEAVVKQIEGSLTSDQLKAIEAMAISETSVNEVLSTLGGSVNAGAPASTPSASTNSQAGPVGGPDGVPPAGDSMGVGDITGGLTAQSTPAAAQATAATSTVQVNPMLLRTLIQLLETRSQTTG